MADAPLPPNPSNPYAAPTATVSDQATADFANCEFEPTGLTVPARRGWDWIKRGWRLFRAQMGLWIGVTITFFILCVAIQILPFIGFLISFVLAPILLAGIMIGCRKLDEGGRMAFADLFAAFSRNVGQLVFLGVLELVLFIGLLGITYLLVGDMGQVDAMFQRRGSSLPAGPGVALMPLVMMALAAPYLAAIWFAPALVVFNNFAAPAALL
ncbi:MAG: BPSS1780 family membrane protein, partial [Burkholderiales bacterium]